MMKATNAKPIKLRVIHVQIREIEYNPETEREHLERFMSQQLETVNDDPALYFDVSGTKEIFSIQRAASNGRFGNRLDLRQAKRIV